MRTIVNKLEAGGFHFNILWPHLDKNLLFWLCLPLNNKMQYITYDLRGPKWYCIALMSFTHHTSRVYPHLDLWPKIVGIQLLHWISDLQVDRDYITSLAPPALLGILVAYGSGLGNFAVTVVEVSCHFAVCYIIWHNPGEKIKDWGFKSWWLGRFKSCLD